MRHENAGFFHKTKYIDKNGLFLSDESIVDWDSFLTELISSTSEFSVYLRNNFLSAEIEELFNQRENSSEIKTRILNVLNIGMVNRIFYDPLRFPNLDMLDTRTQNLIINSIKRKGLSLVKANRIVFDLHFEEFIKPMYSKTELFRDKYRYLFKRVQRRWRIQTANFRICPSFIIAGVQRCGTSSLLYYLCQHPNIIAPERKEINFFSRPNYSPDIGFYKSFFPFFSFMNKKRITGEATPEYSFNVNAMKRIRELLPHIKIILILRDPIQRAISHYKAQEPHRRPESLRSAIQLDLQLFRNRDHSGSQELNYEERLHSYVSRGRYIDYIPLIYQIFPREKILVIKSEDMFDTPVKITNLCFDFLGLDNFSSIKSKNYTDVKRMSDRILQRLKDPPEGIDEKIVRDLYRYFKPYNEMFYEFIGQDMGWDK